ncbi:MAG: InlB B-repeat-containing protein, partial [Oscillospiraceae bacterium]|nr:InlB B-repeat-containing protein [Oscillospiraceae bacterium]
MKTKLKRLTSIFLAFVMALSLLATVFANTVTVTFHANGGLGELNPSSRELNAGVALTGANAPPNAGQQLSRDDHVLAATPQWFRNPEGVGAAWNMSDAVTSNMDLYVNWRPLHNVTFDFGTVLEQNIINQPIRVTFTRHGTPYVNRVADGETVTSSQIVGNTASPRTMGLLFDKWYTDPDLTTAAVLNNPVRAPLNLFAGWLPANNVYFDLNYTNFPLGENEQPLGGKLDSPDPDILNVVQVLDNTIIPSHQRPTNPNRQSAGWNFVGWFEDATHRLRPWNLATDRVPTEIGNMTLYAHWERPINVTLNSNFPGATETRLPDAQRPLAGGIIANRPNPTQRPNVTSCMYWDTGCSTSGACTETAIAPSSRHGNEWSFDGWYDNPEGTGERWLFGTGGTAVGNEDFTLWAKWVKSYVVTYELGIQMTDLVTPANFTPFRYSSIPTPPTTSNPSVTITLLNATRHVHDGWFKEPGLENKWAISGANADVLTEDITLYGGWFNANQLSFDLNYSEAESSPAQVAHRLVPYGETGMQQYLNNSINRYSDPTRTGFIFEGWFMSKAGVGAWDINDVVTEDTIVYAKWTRRVTVEFHVLPEHSVFANSPLRPNPAGSTRISNTILNQGQTATNPINDNNRNSIIDEYTIVGWCQCLEPNCEDPDCVWDFSNPVVPNYTDESGALFLVLIVNVVKAVQVSYNVNWPEGSGTHIGGGWLVTISGTANQIVNQMYPGERLTSAPSALTSAHTTSNNRNVPIIGTPPYQFAGWYNTKAGADSLNQSDLVPFGATGKIIEEDTILYAGWSRGYAVTFEANPPAGVTQSIAVPDAIFVQPGGRATNPNPGNNPAQNPQLADFRFVTWYTDAECTVVWNWNTTINANVTLYAGWIRTYIVSFNLGEGVEGIPPNDAIVPTGGLVPDPELVLREGYAFVGWYRNAAGARTLNPVHRWDLTADTVTGRTTLTAGWIEVHNVSFELNYETTLPNPNVQQIWDGGDNGVYAERFPDRTYVLRIPPPMRSGWTFIGWYTEPIIDTDTMSPWIFTDNIVNDDTVLYAGWLEGTSVNPLWARLDEIMKAAEDNNGQTLNVDMGSYTVMPRTIMGIIRGRNVNLNLDLGGYVLHVSGLGMTAEANRDRNLTVPLEYGVEPWILNTIPKAAVDEEYDDGRDRPIWQIIISNDINDIARSITLRPGAENNHSEDWNYGILISRGGIEFADRRSALITTNGNLTLNLSISDANEFIILINDVPTSYVEQNCVFCGFPFDENGKCQCAEPCEICSASPCICVTCPDCGQLVIDGKCNCDEPCEICGAIPCECVTCPLCGELEVNCICDEPCEICDKLPCECPECDRCGEPLPQCNCDDLPPGCPQRSHPEGECE